MRGQFASPADSVVCPYDFDDAARQLGVRMRQVESETRYAELLCVSGDEFGSVVCIWRNTFSERCYAVSQGSGGFGHG